MILTSFIGRLTLVMHLCLFRSGVELRKCWQYYDSPPSAFISGCLHCCSTFVALSTPALKLVLRWIWTPSLKLVLQWIWTLALKLVLQWIWTLALKLVLQWIWTLALKLVLQWIWTLALKLVLQWIWTLALKCVTQHATHAMVRAVLWGSLPTYTAVTMDAVCHGNLVFL